MSGIIVNIIKNAELCPNNVKLNFEDNLMLLEITQNVTCDNSNSTC